MRYEQVENGTPFCFLVAAVSRQSDQRRQNHWERPIADQQSSHECIEDGGEHLTTQQYLFGGTVSPTKNQARRSRCHQGYGCQAGSIGVSNAALWHDIRRPRSGVLRRSAPQTANQLSQTQSRQSRI